MVQPQLNIFSGDIELENDLDDETDELKEGIVCIYISY